MKQKHLIDFRGPALTLVQVAEKASYVEATFADRRSKIKGLSRLYLFCGILGGMLIMASLIAGLSFLQRGYFSPHINPLTPLVGSVVFFLILVISAGLIHTAALLGSPNSSKALIGKTASEALGDKEIYFTWLSTASKDEMLEPSKSLADLKLFKKIMDHPVGGEFSGYIRGVLQQRDMTAYEQHFLKREFEAAEEQHDKEVALKDAEALRALLVSDPSQ